MFDEEIRNTIVGRANAARIDPAALLAVVEIESAGRMFEADGITPRLLFERHVFYRELKKRAPQKLDQAARKGLTRTSWDRATQYKDQATSQGRLKVIAMARAVDVECANRSASWGLGQTMGFNAPALGFVSATVMVEYMMKNGLDGQVECLIREIRRNKLEDELESHDWAAFARAYNGPGYRANRYDTKLAAAYAKWQDALDPKTPETGEEEIELPTPRPQVELPPETTPEKPAPQPDPDKSMTKSKTVWGGIIAWFSGNFGFLSSIWEKIDNPYALAAFGALFSATTIGLILVIKGRIDVQKVVQKLSGDDAP